MARKPKRGKVETAFDALHKKPVHERLAILACTMSECADRCAENAVTSGSWIEEAFRSMSDHLELVRISVMLQLPPDEIHRMFEAAQSNDAPPGNG